MSVNKVILIGNLGKDPELKYTPSGTAKTTFPLATNEKWTGADGEKKEKTVWHNIVMWGKIAETAKEYLVKGMMVYLEGKIDNRQYDDKDGNKRYISEVVVSSMSFLGGRKAEGQPENQAASAPEAQPEDKDGGDDSELPF